MSKLQVTVFNYEDESRNITVIFSKSRDEIRVAIATTTFSYMYTDMSVYDLDKIQVLKMMYYLSIMATPSPVLKFVGARNHYNNRGGWNNTDSDRLEVEAWTIRKGELDTENTIIIPFGFNNFGKHKDKDAKTMYSETYSTFTQEKVNVKEILALLKKQHFGREEAVSLCALFIGKMGTHTNDVQKLIGDNRVVFALKTKIFFELVKIPDIINILSESTKYEEV